MKELNHSRPPLRIECECDILTQHGANGGESNFRAAEQLRSVSITAKRMKKQPRQGCGIKDSHPCIFAHPGLPCGWHIKIKSRNVLCYRFSNLVFCHGTELREILNDLCARIHFDTHAPLIRKFCSAAIKLSNTARTMSAMFRHVLENQ